MLCSCEAEKDDMKKYNEFCFVNTGGNDHEQN